MKRTFRDLVPGADALRKRIRQVVSGGTIAGVGLTPAASAVPASTPDAPTALIANKSAKTKKLVLQLPDGTMYKMLQHVSHSSHASHSSHVSHYSGSSGTGTATTSSTPSATTANSGKVEANSRFSGTITAVDKIKRTVTIKIASGATYTIGYRDDTLFQAAGATSSNRLDDMLAKSSGKLPFEKGEKIDVTWRTSAGTTGLIATQINKTP